MYFPSIYIHLMNLMKIKILDKQREKSGLLELMWSLGKLGQRWPTEF